MLINLAFHIFLYLCVTHSSVSVSYMYSWAQNWTQRSRCGLTSGEQRRRIPSLDLLPTLFIMQAWDAVGLVCCKGTLLAPVQLEEPLDPFLKSCFPASLSTACTGSLAQDLTFSFIVLHEVSVSLWSKKLAGPNSQAPS